MIPPPTHALRPLDWFQENPANRTIELDDALRELAASIAANGLLQPILSLETGFVLAGHRRLLAMRHARLAEAATLIYPADLTETQRRIIGATENLQRLDLAPPDIFRNCDELMALNPEWCLTDLARHLNKSNGAITQYMAPKKLVAEAFDAFMAGEFGFNDAYAISRSPDQLETLRIKRGGGNREALRKSLRVPRADAVRTAKIKVPLLSGVTIQVAGEEISLEECAESLKEALKAVNQAIGKSLNAKTAQLYWRDLAAAGS